MGLAFEQLPRESTKAFAAFKVYLDMGPERSLAAVAEKLGRSKRMMEKWSLRWRWSERVAAHGAHLAEVERRAIEKVAVAKAVEWAKVTEGVRREAWRKAEELVGMVDDFLARWRESDRLPGFESVVRGIELAIRLKQLAAGMPSEIKEVNTTVTGTVDVEWEIALRKIYGGEGRAGLDDGKVVEVAEVGEPARIGAGEKREENGDGGAETEPTGSGAANAPVGGGEA